MDDLKIIANDVLPVYENEFGEKFVNARELHDQLMVGKDFTTWIRDRIDKYGFTENEDYTLTLTKIGERQNVTRHDYILTLDTAKEIAMVQNNEMGRVIRKYFIEIEKRYRLEKPKSQAELLLMYAKQFVATERRVAALESKVNDITTIVAINPKDWRPDVNRILNTIVKKSGMSYQDIRKESYELLETRAACKLNIRLDNMKKNAMMEGMPKSRTDKINKMDVIAADKRLTEIYLAIVKEMAIKYQIDAERLGA